jgi:hypothetical protein
MATFSFVEKHAHRHVSNVMLYRGKDMQGRDFFAYLDCPPEGLARLREDEEGASAMHDLAEYGDVIYLDFIAEPDAKAQTFLARYFTELAETADAQ